MATGDKLVNLDVLKNTVQKEVVDLKSATKADEKYLIGKENLITNVSWTADKYINGSGAVGDATGYMLSDKITVTAGKTYAVTFTSTIGYYRVAAYNNSDEFVPSLLINGSTGTERTINVTIPSGATYIRVSGYNSSYTFGIVEGNTILDKITLVQRHENVLLSALNVMAFDTTAQTLTIPKNLYFILGATRYDQESNDTVISYGSAGTFVSVVSNSSGTISAVGATAVDFNSQIVLFTFQKNALTNPATNNITYPYYVDGVLYNPKKTGAVSTLYVDGSTGSDSNNGSSAHPFATIQKAINLSPQIIKVARGTYSESLTINAKNGLQIVPASTPTFSTSAFDVPMIVVKQVSVANSNDLLFRDIHANDPALNAGSWTISNCTNVTFDHCWASNGEGGGFVATNLYGRFLQCKAWDVGDSTHYNADGFNLHGYGVTELIDCVAHDCYDDGISHHDGCVCTIKGGEYYNCTGGGGISPVNRYCEIDGAYCHDNKYGIESVQATASDYDPYILIKNSVLKNNTTYDLSIGAIPVKMLRCTYDTKSVATGATFMEIS